MARNWRILLFTTTIPALVSCQSLPPTETNAAAPAAALSPTGCADMAQVAGGAPVKGLVISTASEQADGTTVSTRGGPVAMPAHCLVEGYFAEEQGVVGGPYRIGFRMRMPAQWNGKFLFQGGGGSNGVVGDALGFAGVGNTPGLLRGYAVIAQDSGHDNAKNTVPTHGGELVFGHDPVARANYGHVSLKQSYDLAQYLITAHYARKSDKNMFWGCSKGGQEGMAFAQRYPDAFDGIVASAPGFSLPKAAIAEAWDTQHFAGISRAKGETPSIASLKQSFSPAQFGLVRDATLAACDALDGTKDDIVGAFRQCTTARVTPELKARQCKAGQNSDCLSGAQIDALTAVMGGPKNSKGEALYTDWPWDGGIGTPGWNVWKIGAENGPPALNVALGAGSWAAVFSSPPTPLTTDPEALLAWQLRFSFDTDAPRIFAVTPPFKTSGWQDVGMRSPDLSAFRARGGRMIVPHGVSDPVFSANDTIAWWHEVDALNGANAADFVRVFPVPGMNHCQGGPATDRFDSLTALERWVDAGTAPASIPAEAGADTPWPGRKRPLCAYPAIAVEVNGQFACQKK